MQHLAPRPVGHAEKGHMSAAYTVPKEKLFCKHCDTKNSHNTAAYIKKQKADKEKKQGENNGIKENTSKLPTNSQERRTASEEVQKRNLSNLKTNGSRRVILTMKHFHHHTVVEQDLNHLFPQVQGQHGDTLHYVRCPCLSCTSLQEQKAVVSLLMMNHPNHGLDLVQKRI